MKSIKFLWLALFVGALALAGCKSGGEEAGGEEAAEGSGAAEAVEEAVEEGSAAAEEAVEAVEEAAAEAAEAPAAEAGGDFAASAEALHGTWNADFQALLASQEMSEEERALATAMLGSASMAITFNADGTMSMAGSMMGQEQSESGTFTVVSTEGNKLTLSGTTAGGEGEEPETQTFTLTFASATAMTMADDTGEAIPFNKAQ